MALKMIAGKVFFASDKKHQREKHDKSSLLLPKSIKENSMISLLCFCQKASKRIA
jgi:hypothetical protein